MKYVISIYFIVMGVLMIIKPKLIWKIADSWKVKTTAEPTKFYLQLVQTAGCILGIGGIFVIFVN